MRIEADLDACVGSGLCALTAPTVFDQNEDDGRVLLRVREVDPEDLELVKEAVESCPAAALVLLDDSR